MKTRSGLRYLGWHPTLCQARAALSRLAAEFRAPPEEEEILMGCTISCDKCGRWQRTGCLTESAAMAHAQKHGWIKDDDLDLCKLCAANLKARKL
jgi:hypothetical protein